MKRFVSRHAETCALLALLAFGGAVSSARAQTKPELIPQPRHVEMGDGRFLLDGNAVIAAPDTRRAREIADFLRDAIRAQTGVAARIAPSSTDKRANIALRIDASVAGDEAYRLDVSRKRVEIAASDPRGLFWGVQTLRQLLPAKPHGDVSIPALRIDDAPAYAWRGAMLDVARHFFPVGYVEKQIDLMSSLKLDVFHWHLTDDQGWRIRIRRYPRLTDVGAWRTEADGSRYGGFYTQQQIRDVVEYARLRNVMVVPEIEMPGHASAALAAYPELSCDDKSIPVPNTWGVHDRADCVGKDSVFAFLRNVLDEVIALFPSPYIHIGGDEVPEDVWQGCASCDALAKANGLEGEPGLHGYFVQRIDDYLKSRGKTLIGWDEILEGRLAPDAVVEMWRGDAETEKALANGNRVIVSGPFYLDTPIDGMTLQDIYRTDAFVDPAYAAHRGQVMGAEAPLWAERITPSNGEAMLYPRLMAIAEHLWNPETHDYVDFQTRVQSQERRFAMLDVAYGPEDRDIVDYDLGFNPAYKRWRLRAARGFDDVQLHYTTDGGTPTKDSPWFGDVLDLYAPPATLQVAPFRNGVPYHEPAVFRFAPNLALGMTVAFTKAPDAPYAGTAMTLVDGILGSDDFRDGAWNGWHDADMQATIDLQRPTTLHAIDVHFLQYAAAWILPPREVDFAVSDDGKNWKAVSSLPMQPDPKDTRLQADDASFKLPSPLTARYLRVTATRYGQPVAGLRTWLFCDEIVVQ